MNSWIRTTFAGGTLVASWWGLGNLTDLPSWSNLRLVPRRLWVASVEGSNPDVVIRDLMTACLWLLVGVVSALFVIGLVVRAVRIEVRGRWRGLLALAMLFAGGVSSTSTRVAVAAEVSAMDGSGASSAEDHDGVARDVAISLVSTSVGAGVAVVLMRRRRDATRSVSLTAPVDRPSAIESSETNFVDDLRRARRVQSSIRHLVSGLDPVSIERVLLTPRDEVIVDFGSPVKPIRYWTVKSSRSLSLPDSTSEADLDLMNAVVDVDEPMLLHVGHSAGNEVWVVCQPERPFVIDGPDDEAIPVWKALVAGASMDPFQELPVLTRDSGRHPLTRSVIESSGSIADVAVGCAPVLVDELLDRSSPSNPTIARGTVSVGLSGLRWSEGTWTLHPGEYPIEPIGWVDDEIQRIRQVLGDDFGESRVRTSPVVAEPRPVDDSGAWRYMVCVLGHPEVRHHSGERVRFGKAKGEELVVWLALHPEQRRRGLARTALWNASVKDATFSNVAFDARRSLVLLEPGTSGDDWIPITMKDELPLSELVTTDVRELGRRFDRARRCPEDDGIGVLRSGLELVRGTPFSDSEYLWPDQIGVSGEAAVLVVRSALLMADMSKEIGDIDGVYWATAKGLLALPGHEELVGIRMRTHAEFGDFSAVRSEWDSYCRALAVDEWGPTQPSPKLIELWKRLCLRST